MFHSCSLNLYGSLAGFQLGDTWSRLSPRRHIANMPDRVKASSVQMTDDTDELPSWDTTPLGLRFFLNSMPEYVEDIDPDMVTMVEYGYCPRRRCIFATCWASSG